VQQADNLVTNVYVHVYDPKPSQEAFRGDGGTDSLQKKKTLLCIYCSLFFPQKKKKGETELRMRSNHGGNETIVET
jgi:hypothetical protein